MGACPNKKMEATRSFGPNIKIVEFSVEFRTLLPNITGWVSVLCGEVPFLASLGVKWPYGHHFRPYGQGYLKAYRPTDLCW